MTRLEYLRQKHSSRFGRDGRHSRLSWRTISFPPLVNILEKQAKIRHQCKECRKFRKPECTWHGVLASDPVCEDFQPKQTKHAQWVLDPMAQVPPTLKPCGFYGDTLTEATWLPYRKNGETALRPSVLLVKKDGYKIIDFMEGNHNIKGTFPSQELYTLMKPEAIQILQAKTPVEPKDVDKRVEEAFVKHLSMPKAEMIVAKRWIEATYFYDVFDAFPIESILGVSESGKSRLCMVNLALCYHAEGLIDPTEASIFRAKEEDKVTLIVDEAEYLNYSNLFSTLRILINASYSKASGYVTRYDEQDGRRVKRRFDLYSPMAISGIAGLEGVTLSRAFRIVMRRTNKDYPKAYMQDYDSLRNLLYVLRIRHCFEIHDLYRKLDISNIVSARFEELFKPLFVLTQFMGSKEEHEILTQWCQEYETNFRTEALNIAEEEAILLSINKLEPVPNHQDWYSIKELCDILNAEYNRNVSSKYVSNVLYRLGLTKRKKVKGYTLFYASQELLEQCASAIGVTIETTPQSNSTTSPTSTNSTTLSNILNGNWYQKAKQLEGEQHDQTQAKS